MPIKLKALYEPFTRAAWKSEDGPPEWPTCEALEALERDIERYCKGEIRGRSFLIAGHRGSGKTTLVNIAIQRIIQRWKTDQNLRYFPLFVPLHGPDFLIDHLNTEKQIHAALSEVVKATLRSVSEQLSHCADTMAEKVPPDLLEATAQLHVELDHAPELAALREYWEYLGALQDGFLIRKSEVSRTPGQDQGFKELIALHTCIDAYRVLAKPKNVNAEGQTHASNTATGLLHSKWRDIAPILRGLTPFVSIAAGIIVASTLREFFHPAMLVTLGLATTLICTIFLRSTVFDHKERTLFAETSPAALDRLLPVLVGRLLHAGMAPVFVVDELDKVKGLDRKLEALLTHLKHFIADRAFSCFLADRSYFESVVSSVYKEAYPIQSTLFSARFLVQYTPEALRGYLCHILEADSSEPGWVKELVINVFLHMSRLHIGDLHRVLGEHTDRDGLIRLPEANP